METMAVLHVALVITLIVLLIGVGYGGMSHYLMQMAEAQMDGDVGKMLGHLVWAVFLFFLTTACLLWIGVEFDELRRASQ